MKKIIAEACIAFAASPVIAELESCLLTTGEAKGVITNA
jgi:hypothetical protein